MAMSPRWSIATEPIHRQRVVVLNVDACVIVGVVERPRTSYQRMPVAPVAPTTVWVRTTDSWSPKFRYGALNMRRSPSVSSIVGEASCGTQFGSLIVSLLWLLLHSA